MKEDKILRKIHQTQARLRKEYKNLSWDEEAKLIDQVAKKVASKYHYRILPSAKTLMLFSLNKS